MGNETGQESPTTCCCFVIAFRHDVTDSHCRKVGEYFGAMGRKIPIYLLFSPVQSSFKYGGGGQWGKECR